MFITKGLLAKPGRKIAKAIKKFTESRLARKAQYQAQLLEQQEQRQRDLILQLELDAQNRQNAQMEAPGWKIQQYTQFDSLTAAWSLPVAMEREPELEQREQQAQDRCETASDSSSSAPVEINSGFYYYYAPGYYYPGECLCCHCDEQQENQRNENRENEMQNEAAVAVQH